MTLADQTSTPSLTNSSIESLAKRLAKELIVAAKVRNRESEFRKQVLQDSTAIATAYKEAVESLRRGEPLSVQAEWLLDNYYVVEEQIRDIEDHLPVGFFRQLPKIQNGKPRIAELAREFLGYCEYDVDEPTLYRFIDAFQLEDPFTVGETWAFPILLRLGLLQGLRGVAVQMSQATASRRDAER